MFNIKFSLIKLPRQILVNILELKN